ncbi:hypothetical protein FOA52_001866 [Chlamydomonas sp. UWO 241]|nr:hypothetical protein FOA52_001866 [Chlamydomonas sp. UWO 241]
MAGIGPWRMRVHPQGNGADQGTHLSVFLELQDAMWAPEAVKYKLTAVNQADASKSLSRAFTSKFCIDASVWGPAKLIELSVLRDAATGWLVNETLVLTADVTVEHEDRFELDKGASSILLPMCCQFV